MKNTNSLKKIISGIMAAAITFSLLPASIQAAQSNEYVDPADRWIEANGRTNEFDINATTTYETFYCPVCDMQTSNLVYRVPEYTRTGQSALLRNIRYSDGTFIDESGFGNLDFGTPGVDSYYTGNHWTKSVCQSCNILNTVDGFTSYARGKNIYILNSCDSNFFAEFDNTAYEQYNSTYHKTILKKGQYCQYCKGTHSRATEKNEHHNFKKMVDAQLGNQRFYVSEKCDECGYEDSEYVVAKSVISSYYGVADGEAHTVTVSDLSESGVSTSIRYGTSAGNCNKTSAPNYTKAGYYPIYYDITYSYNGESMTESGVNYVWLLNGGDDDDSPSKNTDIHIHDFRYIETIKPTCDELGFERWQCSGCGALEKRNYIQSIGHNYKQIVIREADCQQGGFILNMCEACGDFYTETTPIAAHSYKENKVNATCIKSGYTEYECTVCGNKYISDISGIINHEYESKTIAPTCEDKGYTIYTCVMCKSMYIDDYVDALGHEWDNGRIVTNSGCVSEGVMEHNCTHKGCKEKLIEAINANGHTPGKEATCTEPQFCDACGTVLSKAKGHSYSQKVIEPTCMAMGYTIYSCDNCSDMYLADYTDRLEHNYAKTIVEPTCTEYGYTIYNCVDCDAEYISDYIEKLAHNYEAVVTAPTCTAMGFTKYICKDCNDTYVSDYTDVLDHNYNKETILPTCTEHGYAVYTCPDCGKSYIGDYVDCKNHFYIETVVEPTCTEMGYTIFKCNDCGDEYISNYTSKVAHNYEKTVVEPTCVKMGYTKYTCPDCGDTYKADYIEALGHKLSDWIVDTKATIEASGKKHIECLTCGEVLQTAEIPQLIDIDNSDEDGNAEVGGYSIILTNKDGKPIFDSEITIDVDDNVTIKLPEGRLLDYSDRTTITVFYTETQEAKSDLHIFIYDMNNNAATGTTDKNGQLSVPNNQSSTGDDNGTVGGEKGEGEEKEEFTYVVTVTDKTNVVIPNCDIYIGEANNLVVDLPDGIKPTRDNPVIVTVTDQNGVAQKDVTIIALGEKDYIEKGTTDIYGKITLPISDEGYTDEDGKVNVEQLNVIVNDETGLIPDAFVKHNDDGTIEVTLPENKCISYENRVTVKVVDSIGKAVAGITVTVKDLSEKSYTAVTDKDGKVTVPPTNFDVTDVNGYGELNGFIVTVKNETAPIENANLFIDENNAIKVDLPETVKIVYNNRITVTVVNKADNKPVKDISVTVNETESKSAEEESKNEEENAEATTQAPKSLTGITDRTGSVVFPPLSEDITDDDGNSDIIDKEEKPGTDTDGDGNVDTDGETVETKYIVSVKDTKGIITDAFVEVKEGKIYVTLPDTHTLITSNQTTVTVLDKDNKPVSGLLVTIKDKTTEKSGTTNSLGQVTLPVKSSGGGSSGGSSGGGSGTSYYSSVNVTVKDKDGMSVTTTKSVTSDKVTLTLPNGYTLDDNIYTITVKDRNGNVKPDFTVVLKDKNKKEVTGKTDNTGVVVLPGKEHKAYIVGYPDGTFKPNGNMSRAEATEIFARLIAEEKDEVINGKASFKDISSTEWYAKAIGYLEKYDIIKGYSDNSFKPDEFVTRAEFVTMAVRYFDLFNDVKVGGLTVKYTDVSPSYWAYENIAYAKNIGWLNGYADGSFKGDNYITRAEVVTVVNNVTNRKADEKYINANYTKLNRFTDVNDNNEWYFSAVYESCNTHTAVSNGDMETWVK